MKSVLEVLNILNDGENYLVKVNNYNRISNKSVDEFDMFERNAISVPTPFELMGNENRLNISLQNKIYGIVKINPIQARKVGLSNTINSSMIYRNKTVIRDGKLNVEELELIVDTQTYLLLKKNNINFKQLENDTTYPGFKIILNLVGLPIINATNNISLDEILENVNSINVLKAKQKVLNSLIKELPKEEEAIPGFTEEQTQLLKEYGLNEKLQYIGIENKTNETEEVYDGEIIEFKVKGSSMNSFKKVLERIKENKKLNKLDQIQYDFYNDIKDKVKMMGLTDVEDLKMFYKSELKKIKGQLFSIKMRNTIIKIEFINSEISEVAFDSDNTFSYNGLVIVRKEEKFTK